MTNEEVINEFLHQRKAAGKNSLASILYNNNTIYSYGEHFIMGVITGSKEITITTRKYSATTSNQTSLLAGMAAQDGYTITREAL